jgi:hypothetical protein
MVNYEPPRTLSYSDYINPLSGNDNEDGKAQFKSNKSKGFKFEKT